MECIIHYVFVRHRLFSMYLADSLWYPGGDFAPEFDDHDQVHDEDRAHRNHEAGDEKPNVEHSKVVLVDVKSADVAS